MIAVAVAKHLMTRGLLIFDETLPTADCFIASLPPEPDNVVMLRPVAGHKPEVKFGYDYPSLQLWVRDRDYRTGEERALALYSEMQSLRTATLDEGGSDEVRLLDCQSVASGPAYLNTDENGRHEWSMNFDLSITNPTAHRK